MPYRVVEKGTKYFLWNLHKKEFVGIPFKSRKTAITSAKNYIRFREKVGAKVRGNDILPNKK